MNIGVFFGGKSPEHDVSIITGQLIISELKKTEHRVIPVYLDKDGFWRTDEALSSLGFFHQDNFLEKLDDLGKYSLDLEKSRKKIILRKKGFLNTDIVLDFAFPAFHGMNGEDGTIQGLFEIFNLPYAGCDVASSALAMDKILTKVLYKAHNITTADFLYFTEDEWNADKDKVLAEIENKLKYPLFIKPPKLGSSIGISRAKTRQELEFGIEVAFHYGERVLIENGVGNLVDITCAVLGNNNPTPSLVQESSFTSDFFNYEEKYLKDGGAQTGNAEKSIIIPAKLDEDITKEVQNLAIKIFSIFGCTGTARVDFLYDKVARIVYANEINTLPGTLYHHLWKASGLELRELIQKLIDLGVERHKKNNSYQYIFESNILKSTKSAKLKK